MYCFKVTTLAKILLGEIFDKNIAERNAKKCFASTVTAKENFAGCCLEKYIVCINNILYCLVFK